MWYKLSKIILADIQQAIEKLKESGISQEIIDFVNSFPDDQTKGRLIGALSRNPSLSLSDLQTQILQKRQYQPTEQEKFSVSRFNTEDFKRWMLFVLKNKRASTQDEGKTFNYSFGDLSDFIRESNHLEDFYVAFKRDNPMYQLGSKTWEEVKEDSDEWHEAISNRGSGKFYEPYRRDAEGNLDDERIVRTYPDGYKMVRVESSNDLDVEGHLMHHCVGSYASEVRRGSTTIYSLRDPYNRPKVTIEVSPDGQVKQIQGPSNSEVHDEDLVEKIKEFFEEDDSIVKDYASKEIERYYENYDVDWGNYPDDIKYSIVESIYGPYIDTDQFDEVAEDFSRFGLNPSFDEDEYKANWFESADILDITKTALEKISENIGRKTWGGKELKAEDFNFDECANVLLEAACDKTKKKIESNAESIRNTFRDIIEFNDVEKLLDKFLDEYDQYLEYIEGVQITPTNPKEVLKNMLDSQDGLLVYIAKNYKTQVEEANLNEACQRVYHQDFALSNYTQRRLSKIEPFLNQSEAGAEQLRLFVPSQETIGEDNNFIDQLTGAKVKKDNSDDWAYAKTYNNRRYKQG